MFQKVYSSGTANSPISVSNKQKKVEFDMNVLNYNSFSESSPLISPNMTIINESHELNILNTKSHLISKVFAVLSIQLLLTSIVSFLMYKQKTFASNNFMFNLIVSVIISLVFVVGIVHTKNMIKLMFAFLLSISCGFLLGLIIVNYDVIIILHSLVITLGTTVFCIFFVCLTNIELNNWKNNLITYSWLLIISIIVSMIFPIDNLIHLILSILASILFVSYLMYDISNLMENKNNLDYVDISTNIYLDIFNIFTQMTQIIGFVNVTNIQSTNSQVDNQSNNLSV